MKKLIWFLLFIPSLMIAQTKEEAAVAAAVEKLRLAMLSASEQQLSAIASPLLTYGHSGGMIEDKKAFVDTFVSGKSKFTSLNFDGQSIQIQGSTAIVRHSLTGETADKGKEPGKVNIFVLLVFAKEKGQWILLARQAVKKPA